MSANLVYVITEADRQSLITWLNGLSAATLNQPAEATPAPATEEAIAQEATPETSAEEQAPTEALVAQDASEVTVESQT